MFSALFKWHPILMPILISVGGFLVGCVEYRTVGKHYAYLTWGFFALSLIGMLFIRYVLGIQP
jgi:hypothetical protein